MNALVRMTEINDRQAAIEADARRTNAGQFTASQLEEYQRLDSEYETLKRQSGGGRISRPNSMTPFTASTTLPELGDDGMPVEIETPTTSTPASKWIDTRSGETLRCLSPRERFASPANAGEFSVGRFMRAFGTKSWKHAPNELRLLNLSSTDSSGSHTLIPEQLSSMVIDLARANSVVNAWGASSVEMPTDSLIIAKQASDPSISIKAENVAFSETTVTFGSIGLYSKTLGCLLSASRELAEDAPNFPALIESTMQKALSTELDRLVLLGNGGSEGINGIVNREGIGTTGSVGAIAWEDLHAATIAIRALNFSPNGYVIHPTIAGDCDILTSGDGANSAKLWLGAPVSLAGLARLQTTAIGTGNIIVGDGSKIVLGFRTQARVESSTEAGDSFAKHQILWKITVRFDFGLTHATAFHYLSGITT